MKDVILGMNGVFVTKQYKINLSETLMEKITDIERNTDNMVESYLGELDDVEEIEIDCNDIFIDFDTDLPYELVMDRVAKCIDSFIKENE